MEQINFERVSAKLRELRIQRGFTQEYIATMADVSVTHISNIENNHVKISLTTLVNVCNVLHTTVDYILEHEYGDCDSAIDQEIANEIHTKDQHTKETILKIVRIL